MSFIDKILGGGIAKAVEGVGNVVDKFITTSDEKIAAKLAIEQELNKHKEAMQKQADEVEVAYLKDRDSARSRETEFVKATGHADYFQYFVGGVIMLNFVAVTVYLLKYELPEKNSHVIVNLVGILEGAVIAVISFYFGSSRGSREKNTK